MANPYPPDLTMTRDVASMFDADGADKNVIVGRVQRPGTVNSVEFIPAWTLSGAATNSRTMTLYNRGTAGAGTTAIATLALVSGVNLTKGVAKVIPITAGNAAIVVGDTLQWESLHVGSGLPEVGGQVVVQQTLGS